MLARIWRDSDGAAAILTALLLPVVVGFAGLGAEVAMWYVAERNMQSAADAAAFSGAVVGPEVSATRAIAQARAVAAKDGFTDGVNGVTVTVNHPPASGAYSSNAAAIEVIIRRPQNRLLTALYLASNPTVGGRAVAIAGAGTACVLALDAGASAAAFGNGTTNVDLIGCGLAVNSNSASALTLVGSATVTAQSAAITGGISESGQANLTTTNGTITGAAPMKDPYKDVNVTVPNRCDFLSTDTINHTPTAPLQPGVYCGGISIQGQANVTLNPGVYYIDGGSLSMSGNASLSGSGVTFVLTGDAHTGYATVSISGGATVNLTAPTSGATAGLAFFQDRNAPTGVDNNFTGGSTMNIEGAIYLPNETVNFAGGAATGGGCTQIVADEVAFKGNANLEANCTGKGTAAMVQPPQLVE